jgi:beta-galactosidase
MQLLDWRGVAMALALFGCIRIKADPIDAEPVKADPIGATPVTETQAQPPRVELAADADWQFLLGDPSGAEARGFTDRSWRTVTLPHDWSIEGAPDKNNPTGTGGGFFPAGTGWYRKTFTAPPEWRGRRVSVEFDGV